MDDGFELCVDVAATADEGLRLNLDLEAFGDLVFFLTFLKEGVVVLCLGQTCKGAVVFPSQL